MKMVVAYVDPERFEAIREALLTKGMGTLSLMNASGSLPESTVSGSYRGTSVEGHSRAKVRFECIVGAEHTAIVVDTVLEVGGEHSFVFVVPVEEAHPSATITAGEVVGQTG